MSHKKVGKGYFLAEEKANEKALKLQWTWQAQGTTRNNMVGKESMRG